MERYDYHEAVYDDVCDYIRENIDFSDYDTIEDLADHLNDELWAHDSVTGMLPAVTLATHGRRRKTFVIISICWAKRLQNSGVNRLISPKTARRRAM